MDYEKKYKEIVGQLKKAYLYAQTDSIKAVLEDIFPELKESEDERIRKRIIHALHGDVLDMEETNKALAWLEKQGEKKVSYTTTVETGDGGINALVTRELPTDGCDDGQKPADKVEPKFKVGDWVFIEEIEGYKQGPFQIKYLSKQGYCFDKDRVIPFCTEDLMSFWTIQDAKDGDVLYFSDRTIVIFKELYNATTFHSYCHIEDELFDVSKDDMPDWWEGKGFHPATKEQRSILFQKIKEAGYEWDIKKKELRKIKQEPIWEWDAEKKELKKIEEIPTEWSEEDEHRVKDIIYFLDTAKKHYASTIELDACIAWLKSIKQRIGG